MLGIIEKWHLLGLCFLLLGPPARGSTLWPEGMIPYTFEKNLPAENPLRKTVLKAMTYLEKELQGVLRFQECGECQERNFKNKNHKNHKNQKKQFLQIGLREKCYSQWVGMKDPGPQILGVNNSCNFEGVMIHNLGHVIGLYHQHQRPDRDQYLKIHPQFFPQGPKDPGYAPVFPQAFGVYDYESVMHFSSYSPFLKKVRNRPSFVKKKDGSEIMGGWPWAPASATLKDLSAIWELYATGWGWEPMKREESFQRKITFLGAPYSAASEQWVRGTDNFLYFRKMGAEWQRMGKSTISSDPVALTLEDGRKEVFVSNSSHQVVQISFHPKEGEWGKWIPLGGPLSHSRPSVVLRPLGQWDLFIRGVDFKVYKNTFTPNSGWSGWEDLGGQVSGPPVAQALPGDDHIDVFAPDIHGRIWRKVWQDGKWWPSPTGWTREGMDDFQVYKEKNSPASFSSLGVTSCFPGHLALVARGSKGVLYTKFWFGKWGNWVPIGGILKSSPTAECDSKGEMKVWALGEDWNLWVKKFKMEMN